MNAKALNGSPLRAGQLIKPANASSDATPVQRCSASSKSPQLPRFCDRAVSRHERWQQDCQLNALWELRQRQQQEQAAKTRCRLMGHITSILFLVVAFGMAATALHREQQLAPQETQKLQQVLR